jgi:hypothetical protein
VKLPFQFPDPSEEAHRRAAEFQSLNPDQRWREMAALMAFGWAMVRSSPRRADIENRMNEQEVRWQKLQQELFARHGR